MMSSAPMIRFGPWSIFLLVFAGQALALAAALLSQRRNRRANVYLALLLVVIAGMLTPYILGYAGFYDAYPWLSYAPFALPLAIGPLVYAHVRALATGVPLGWLHWLPPAAQFLYQTAVFVQPLAYKNWFDGAVHERWIGPLLDVAVPASMILYLVAGASAARTYRGWLAARRRDPTPASRLLAPLVALLAIAVARVGFELWDRIVAPVDYFDLFGFYVLLALGSAWLGIEGWRRADQPAPAQADVPERDWRADGERMLGRIRDEGWWREPDIGLAGLARRLATNTDHLSRAINATGVSLSEALAAMRSEAVADRIRAGDREDLLAIALDAGFGSKASFNRAFKARFGVTPSAYRVASVQSSPLPES